MSTDTVSQVRLVSIGKRYSGTRALDNVSVEVAGSLQETFDAAFTPDPSPGVPASGTRVHVTVHKIGR